MKILKIKNKPIFPLSLHSSAWVIFIHPIKCVECDKSQKNVDHPRRAGGRIREENAGREWCLFCQAKRVLLFVCLFLLEGGDTVTKLAPTEDSDWPCSNPHVQFLANHLVLISLSFT